MNDFHNSRVDWMGAACIGEDPESFFPTYAWHEEQPRRICHSCPIKEDCLDFALDTGQWGIWGGTNRDDRQRINSGIFRKNCPVCHAPVQTVLIDGRNQVCAFCGISWPALRGTRVKAELAV